MGIILGPCEECTRKPGGGPYVDNVKVCDMINKNTPMFAKLHSGAEQNQRPLA